MRKSGGIWGSCKQEWMQTIEKPALAPWTRGLTGRRGGDTPPGRRESGELAQPDTGARNSGAMPCDPDHAAGPGDGPLLVGEFVVGEGTLGFDPLQLRGGRGGVDLCRRDGAVRENGHHVVAD